MIVWLPCCKQSVIYFLYRYLGSCCLPTAKTRRRLFHTLLLSFLFLPLAYILSVDKSLVLLFFYLHSITNPSPSFRMSLDSAIEAALADFPYDPNVDFLGQLQSEASCMGCVPAINRDHRLVCIVDKKPQLCIHCKSSSKKCSAVCLPSLCRFIANNLDPTCSFRSCANVLEWRFRPHQRR